MAGHLRELKSTVTKSKKHGYVVGKENGKMKNGGHKEDEEPKWKWKKIKSCECDIAARSERAMGEYGHAIFSEGNDHDTLDTEAFEKLRRTAERSVIAKRLDRRIILQELLSQYVLLASAVAVAVARRSIALMKRRKNR